MFKIFNIFLFYQISRVKLILRKYYNFEDYQIHLIFENAKINFWLSSPNVFLLLKVFNYYCNKTD